MQDVPMLESLNVREFAQAMTTAFSPAPAKIILKPNEMRHDLGKLVLTLLELLREVLERQALRRVEAGSLTEEEIERLGTSFYELAQQMEWLKKQFGLEGEELNLDLGPLGRLL